MSNHDRGFFLDEDEVRNHPANQPRPQPTAAQQRTRGIQSLFGLQPGRGVGNRAGSSYQQVFNPATGQTQAVNTGQVGSPNLGAVGALQGALQQGSVSPQYLQAQGLMPTINGIPLDLWNDPVLGAQVRRSFNQLQNNPNPNPNAAANLTQYWNFVAQQNRAQGGAPGSVSRQQFQSAGGGNVGTGGFNLGNLGGLLGGNIQRDQLPLERNLESSIMGILRNPNPYSSPVGGGTQQGGFNPIAQLQNALGVRPGGQGQTTSIENALRTRQSETIGGAQRSAEERARANAVRRGQVSGGEGDEALQSELSRISAEGGAQQVRGDQDLARQIADLTRSSQFGAIGAGTGLLGQQLGDRQNLVNLIAMLSQLSANQGLGTLGNILGTV